MSRNRVGFGGEPEPQFIIAFDLSTAGLLDAVRAIPLRRFDRDSKVWKAPWSSAPEVKAVAERYAMTVLPEAQVVLEAVKALMPAPAPTTRRLNTVGERIEVVFAYDPALIKECKAVGLRFDAAKKVWWTVPNEGDARALVGMAERFGFIADDKTTQWLTKAAIAETTTVAASKSLNAELSLKLGLDLYPFQKAGVLYAINAKRGCIIGDEMGLGKTPQALAVIEATQAYPALFITTASMRYQIAAEVKKWLGRDAHLLTDGKGLYGQQVVVVNYDVLSKNLDLLLNMPFKAVIADESQRIKTKGAQRTVATKALMALPSVEVKLLLTGTAVLNRPAELISQLDVIDRLKDFGGFWRFAQRYCGAYKDRFGLNIQGATNLEELNERLRATCYVRREKSAVLPELPPVQNVVVPIDIDNRKEYNSAEADIATWLGQVAARKARLAGLSDDEAHLAQMKAEVAAARAETLVRIEALKQLAARGKLAAALTWVRDLLDGNDEKILIFAAHRDIVKALSEELGAPAIYGGTSETTRRLAVDRFQNDPKCRVLVANIIAAGEGLNLTAANAVVFIEQEWNPARHDQAIARAYGRLSDVHGVTAYWLLARNSIDDDIALLNAGKRAVTTGVITGDAAWSGEKALASLTKSLLGRVRVGTKVA